MAIIIPQIRIKEILDEIISLIKEQHNTKVAASLETESWLYRNFYGVKVGTFDYYEQAKELFVNRGEESRDRLEIRRDFDRDRASLPTIFINTPSESQDGVNAIGMNYDVGSTYYENDDGSETDSYGRAFRGVYELMCTSSNKDEVELLYRFLECVFIAFADTWNDNFNDTFTFSGKQLMPNPDVIPTPLMIRVWTITIGDIQEVAKFDTVEYLEDVLFEGTPENID